MILRTPRLTLRPWKDTDRDAFAALHADPEVMADLGGPFSRAQADAKLDRYRAAFETHGFTRWAIEGPGLLGYAGIMPHGAEHPMGPHIDLGWRLARHAWGQGYASEAARAALDDALGRVRLAQVLAYTAPDNLRSQAVMGRLGLRRDTARDFTLPDAKLGVWRGLVWSMTAPAKSR